MKTKKFTRLLSGFLAVLMLLTMAPVTAFSATDDDIVHLKAAITSYESKMQQGKIYSGYMGWAYNQYIQAKAYVDAYEYGGNIGLDAATLAGDFEWSINYGMSTEFEGETGTATATFSYSDTASYTNGFSQNVLYSTDTYWNTYVTTDAYYYENVANWVYYTPTVFLYDGKTTPQRPIMASARRNSGKTRYMYSIYPCVSTSNYYDNASFGLAAEWASYNNGTYNVNADWSRLYWNGWYGTESAKYKIYGYNAETGRMGNGNTKPSTSYRSHSLTDSIVYYSNLLQYKGTLESNTYSDVFYPPWYCLSGEGVSNQTVRTSTAAVGATTIPPSLYVVNYEALTDAISSCADVFKNTRNYDYSNWEKMGEFIRAVETATSLDPNSFFTNTTSSTLADDVDTCSTAIKNAVEGITSAKAALLTSADTSYVALRTAITNTKTVYNIGNGDEEGNGQIYDTNSWNAFTTAYNLAVAAINNVAASTYPNAEVGSDDSYIVTGYVSSYGGKEIATIAKELADFKLETLEELADADDLRAAALNAKGILSYIDTGTNSQYFTGSTVTALRTAYNNALAAFTSSDPAQPVIYNSEEQQKVDDLEDALNRAINSVTMNTSRLVEGIAAASAIDPAGILDPAALSRSILNANNALTTAKAAKFTSDNISSLVVTYIDVCVDIENAIVYANTEYTVQTDTITKSPSYGEESVSFNSNNNTVKITYPQGTVIVKTTSDKKSYDVGNYEFYAWHSGSSNDQKIYSAGITNDSLPDNWQNDTNTYNYLKGQMSEEVDGAKFALTGFDGTFSTTGSNGVMVYSGTQPTSINAGLTDGSYNTYWHYRNGEFSHSSPLQFTAPAFSSNENAPTSTTYKVNTSYFYGWYYRSLTFGNASNNIGGKLSTPMDVTVVDISSLLYYQNQVDQYIAISAAANNQWYTEASYTTLMDALATAKRCTKENTISTYVSASAYEAACVSAYNNLKTAISGLTVATHNVTFSYKVDGGTTETKVVSGQYGATLTTPSIPNTYTSGSNTYTFIGWDQTIPAKIPGTVTYTALYARNVVIGEYAALNAVVANVEAVIKANKPDYYDAAVYQNMLTVYDDVMRSAYMSGAPFLEDQSIIDGYTSNLQTAYNALHAKNYFTVTFNVYVDGEVYYESVAPHDVRSNVELIVPSECSGNATWKVNGTEVPNIAGYSYSFIVTRDTVVECYLVSGGIDDTTKVIVLTASGETYKEYYVGPETTITELLAYAEVPTVAYYEHVGWTINGKNPDALIDSVGDLVQRLGDVVKLRPKYESTSDGYVFDEKKSVTSSDTDFLCWVLPVGTDSYRVVSYSKSYTYFTTGKYAPEPVTGANFNQYAGKLQDVTRDMIDAKMPIPSMRGIEEDLTSANGALWDKDIKQLRIISQFTEGYDSSKYTIVNYGVKLARVDATGSTITTALSRTISEQYIVYYSFNTWADEDTRTYSAQSWVTYKIDSGETVTVYSPEAQFNLSLV